ncbi:glycosyltransferase family 2 protein [Microbulbifer hainanensis]|uniref:glycosyltransferase family 2 protein n=1 Tax=Microbulbifer hainanensis TaxID=2735675 RepID=UPI0018682B7E|nr:glycosyltransferase family 2 protein [Microbulbifer hainanensis]
MPPKLVDICICSCQRPQLLEVALDSLARMQVPPGVRVEVTVVDNDPAGSAEQAVGKLAADFPLPLHYVCESRRGIPCARNRGIAEALAKNADYLVFIDDDEWVERNWLVRLYGYAVELGGDAVVSGYVIADLPENTAPVMAEFFQRKRRVTGERLDYCATNNVIIPIAAVRDLGLRFDESRPFAGGEDTLFFTEVVASGIEVVNCVEALVHETILPSRISTRWQARRKYSVGTTQAMQKMACGRSRPRVFVSGFGQLLISLIKSSLFLLVGRKDDSYRNWLKVCRSAGITTGSFGAQFDFYKIIDK